jgi:hypothetical protein
VTIMTIGPFAETFPAWPGGYLASPGGGFPVFPS